MVGKTYAGVISVAKKCKSNKIWISDSSISACWTANVEVLTQTVGFAFHVTQGETGRVMNFIHSFLLPLLAATSNKEWCWTQKSLTISSQREWEGEEKRCLLFEVNGVTWCVNGLFTNLASSLSPFTSENTSVLCLAIRTAPEVCPWLSSTVYL